MKLELFDKRYEIFQNIKKFIAAILTSAALEQSADIQFLRDTKSVSFLFGDEIASLTDEIFKKARQLQVLIKTQETSERLQDNLKKQEEIMLWFNGQLKTMDSSFGKYLKLKH